MERATQRHGLARSLALLLTAAGVSAGEPPLRVRASEAAVPCVEAAARAYGGRPLAVETGALRDAGAADVLVGGGVEITRAIEGGGAIESTETDVARVPWVLSLTAGNPLGLGRLSDLTPDVEVLVLAGPTAYEARRALASHPAERVHETSDTRALREAAVALVPLPLAGRGARVAVDLPPIAIRAAVAARSARAEAARAFVQFLGSEAGQRAFAACAPATP